MPNWRSGAATPRKSPPGAVIRLVLELRYNITWGMTDATTHQRGHDHSHPHAQAAETGREDRRSLLAMSSGARLLGLSPLLAALWAAVYWALH